MVFKITGTITPNSVTVSTGATLLPATALSDRIGIILHNLGSNTVYLGNAAVTSANGLPLESGEKLALDIGNTALLYGIVSTGTSEVRILEGS